MPVPCSLVFRCEFCDVRPDAETQFWLEQQLLDVRHGEYLDMEPGNWLVWHGRGPYGGTRYACGAHRGELKAWLREHYGSFGAGPWAEGPHPWRFRKGNARVQRILRGLPPDRT